MSRYAFYIDGFNSYYALRKDYPQYKWLNYYDLAQTIIGNNDSICKVVYFSAYAKWKQQTRKRHEVYVKALRSAGVEIVMGHFKRRDTKCHLCHKVFRTHEEKLTDVNIAVAVTRDAALDVYDKAILVTADTDLIPVIQAVHKIAPEKEIGFLFPLGRSSYEIRREADFIRKMKQNVLKACLFPPEIPLKNTILRKPMEWP